MSQNVIFRNVKPGKLRIRKLTVGTIDLCAQNINIKRVRLRSVGFAAGPVARFAWTVSPQV